MPDVQFLENYSLYRKYVCDFPLTMDLIPKPPINMGCSSCKGTRTFNMINEYYEHFRHINPPSRGQVVRSVYVCTECREFTRVFFTKISDDLKSIMKIGQYPSWEVIGDNNIEGMLGGHASFYRRGLICESQSYGIAAFAYYRRIVEEIIDTLLNDIEFLVGDAEKNQYSLALQHAKTTKITAEKIRLVKDVLPSILRPNGINPLSLLHEILSEGLHAESDERCLELAEETRRILIFLASTVAKTRVDAIAFSNAVQAVMQKSKKPAR